MPDRERVVEGLRKAAEELARYAPMKVNARCQIYFDGAIHLLKEQEPVKPDAQGDDSFACGNCGETVGWDEMECYGIGKIRYKFCPECGQAVKWDD